MSAAFCASLPSLTSPRSSGLERGDINEAKKVLATEATALCHGREAAEAAAETARAVFESGGSGSELPQTTVPRDLLARGMPAFELFSRAGLAASNGEARRLIRGGGARINDMVVESETKPVSLADLDAQGIIKLSAGRKRHALVRAGLRSYCAPSDCWTGGGHTEIGLEEAAQKPGGESAQRVDRDLRIGGRTGDPVIGGEQALSFAAEQQRADDRHVAEHRVQRIGRHDRALAGRAGRGGDRRHRCRSRRSPRRRQGGCRASGGRRRRQTRRARC